MNLVRLILMLEALAALALYAWHTGRVWATRSNARRALVIGMCGGLAYIAFGQIKASAYDLPVDALTLFGGLTLAVVVVALVILRSSRHEEA